MKWYVEVDKAQGEWHFLGRYNSSEDAISAAMHWLQQLERKGEEGSVKVTYEEITDEKFMGLGGDDYGPDRG